MSWCRWSTDDFLCDLYVWDDVAGGTVVAVAGRRVVYEAPLPDPVPWDPDRIEEILARQQAVRDLPQHFEDITLPHAGEIFREPDTNAAADRVAELRALGYRCPADVEQALREAED